MTEKIREEIREETNSEKPAHPLIFVAPNGARKTKVDHPELPVSIVEIVATAKASFAAGASGIHAHVRDNNGEHILDAGLYLELLEELKLQVPEMAVQITTEAVGRYSPAEQRDLVREVKPKLVSIALREMFEDDDLQAVSRFYYEMREQETEVQHIVYTSQEFTKLVKLTMLGSIPARGKSVLFVLGRYEEKQQSRPEMLEPFLSVLGGLRLAQSWRFMTCAFGAGETACLVACAKAGGDCRVGFENNLLNEDGTMARNNAERVQALVKALSDAGISTASR
jgi:uncharacterized protein (DUF849 family)